GEANYDWNPTGKVGIGLSARRNLVPYFDVLTTHRVDKTVSLTPRWQVTGALSASLALTRTLSDFLGGSMTPAGELRRDRYNAAELAIAWQPTKIAALGAGIQRQRRSSNDPQFSFDATITRVSASLTF